MEQLFANVVSNRKFLYSAFYSYDNEQADFFFLRVMECLQKQSVATGISRVGSFFRCHCGIICCIAGTAWWKIPAYKSKADLLLHSEKREMKIEKACYQLS